MKTARIFLVAALLLWGSAAPTFAWAGDLSRPSLALPEKMGAEQRAALMKVLTEKPADFFGGQFINSKTTLRYRGNTEALNQFLAGLAACPGFRIAIRFSKDLKEASWTLDHEARGDASRFVIHINLDARLIALDKLTVPEIQTADRPADPPGRSSGASPTKANDGTAPPRLR